jgi:hypothetical protein
MADLLISRLKREDENQCEEVMDCLYMCGGKLVNMSYA